MNELIIGAAVVSIVVLIVAAIYLFERYNGCWHRWDVWNTGETNEAYIQFRKCQKCGYTEREQWRKLKEKS